ncbi:hypothetical protein [Nitrosopumilus sp. S4]
MNYIKYSVFFSILALTLLITPAYAGEITKSISNGATENFRDITNLEQTPDPTLSLDKSVYRLGETVIITLNDTNADLDISAIDFATATVSGSSLTLTETGGNTGIFTGSFVAGNTISIDYTPDPKGAARAEINFPLSSSGNVILGDLSFDQTEITNLGIKPVIGAINVTLTNGASFSSVPTVKLSFANANLTGGIDVLDLEMWHKAAGQNWEKITDSCNTRIALLLACTFFDNSAKTITSDPSGGGFSGTDGQGAYVLAINTGIPGGGGGGLVSPGLVVNALAGIGSVLGGGGSGGSAPVTSLDNIITSSVISIPAEIEHMVLNHDSSIPILSMDPNSFEDFDFPLVIDDKGYVLGGFTNTLQTHTLKTNTPVTMKFTVYEAQKIQHFSLYTNLRGISDSIPESDTQILYNDGKPLQIKDPNGFFANATVTILEKDDSPVKQVVLELTFAKEMDTTHIITRTWDPNLFSRDTHILNAIQVESSEPKFNPLPETQEEVQIQEFKLEKIPKWIKNNAEWWVDNEIDDESFIKGIEYLINKGMIYVPNEITATSSVSEIPDWIRNNAGWWADDHISDDDFVNAMQWLVVNGVIRID